MTTRLRYEVRDSEDLPLERDGTPWPRAWDVWDRNESTVAHTARTRRMARELCRRLNAEHLARSANR